MAVTNLFSAALRQIDDAIDHALNAKCRAGISRELFDVVDVLYTTHWNQLQCWLDRLTYDQMRNVEECKDIEAVKKEFEQRRVLIYGSEGLENHINCQ